MIEQELINILKESYDVDIANVDINTKIRDHLDSLDFLGFIISVRKKYHLDIDPAEAQKFQTIEHFADFVRQKRTQ